MYTTIKGRYEKGKLILEETPPADEAEVLVTFTSVNGSSAKTKTRKFGYGKGTVLYMADDFNDPLDDLKEYME